MAKVDERGRETQAETNRRQGEPSAWEEGASKRRAELEKRGKELDTRQAQMTLESRGLVHSRQEVEMRLQGAQDGHIEQTRRGPGVICLLREELMEMAQSRLEKPAPRSGEVLNW